ncbi:MAG: FAD-NAD(P)-binding protein [Gemmobacter sp.]|uniref:FAD-NAD(P)-binding protein n=1 Tax=Gemmobacter sp. TaxID=1898957 RepID=UPI001A4DAF87|nr:FAD-NAD(P)-binding protein [Gemmobacter sp.]MBL8561731.1 FAD-NAD(P)-binding protein [Gemmobacter sp.]
MALREQARVTDVARVGDEVRVTFDGSDGSESLLFSHVVLATGHDWPEDPDHDPGVFVSPWTGLMEAALPATSVGILGTSLSGIDAAMAVACQHGRFDEDAGGALTFHPDPDASDLRLTLMSRQGLLPEADFWCPIPYRPLQHMSEAALDSEVAQGSDGLLDRLWARFVAEMAAADPAYTEAIGLAHLTPEGFAEAYFAPRLAADPFDWAKSNLAQVERNTAARRVVEWRYAILRMHEPMETMVAHLTETDRERFDALKRVFIDNYAAVPPQSIHRLLALHRAGVLDIFALGEAYNLERKAGETEVQAESGERRRFAIFIDARGQRSLGIADLPFPSLRAALGTEEGPVPMNDHFAIAGQQGRLFLPAAPYLLSRLPFVQGITASHDLGEAVAEAILAGEP